MAKQECFRTVIAVEKEKSEFQTQYRCELSLLYNRLDSLTIDAFRFLAWQLGIAGDLCQGEDF